MDSDKKRAAPGANRAASEAASDKSDRTPPTPTGQCAQVLGLRAMGFNILTTIHQAVEFRGSVRRNVASYSLGSPPWPRPGFFDNLPAAGQIELDLDQDRRAAQ